MNFRRTTIAFALLVSATTFAKDAGEWAKMSQNPMADLMKLPVANRFDQGVGHKDGTQYTLAFRPTMASDVSRNWTMVSRFDVPFIYRPGLDSGSPDDHGLGDIQYESFYGPAGWRRIYWGVGPLFEIPSATDSGLGTQKWSAGIGGTAAYVSGAWVAGLRANHLWSFAGSGDQDVNRSTSEYVAYYNFSHGWWVGTDPENTADWEQPADSVWTVPVGGGFGKVVSKGKYAFNLKFEGYYFVEQPTTGAEWTAAFEIEWLFDKNSFFKTPTR